MKQGGVGDHSAASCRLLGTRGIVEAKSQRRIDFTPVIVVFVAIAILSFIMIFIVPTFEQMFEEFGLTLPAPTLLLIAMSNYIVGYWFLLILMPIVL